MYVLEFCFIITMGRCLLVFVSTYEVLLSCWCRSLSPGLHHLVLLRAQLQVAVPWAHYLTIRSSKVPLHHIHTHTFLLFTRKLCFCVSIGSEWPVCVPSTVPCLFNAVLSCCSENEILVVALFITFSSQRLCGLNSSTSHFSHNPRACKPGCSELVSA